MISSVDQVNNTFVMNTPPCVWPDWKPTYAPGPYDANSDALEILNGLNISYILIMGGLLGAFRHGGPIPNDGDMDVVFPVWLNGVATCADATKEQSPILRENDQKELTLCGLTRNDYVEKTLQIMRRKLGARKVGKAGFGGLRLKIGKGVDFVVSIFDEAYRDWGPICRCMFGDVPTLCYTQTDKVLRRDYGEGWTVPNRYVGEPLK